MAIQLTNIAKGIFAKLRRGKSKSSFAFMTWLQEKRLKHQEHTNLKTIRFGKLILRYKRPYEVLHTYKELFEQEIYKFSADGNSPFIIDCGANIGLSVMYFKSLYPESKIIAFEPDEDNFLLLKENVRANGLKDIDCRKSAVWIYNGAISFASDGTQGSQITSESNRQAIEINAERLADIISKQPVDFLKIDIEGAELDVLRDCEPFLKNVKNLFVEYHGKASETEKLYGLLEVLKNNYSIYIKLAADNLRFPFVSKSTGSAFDVQLNVFCFR